LKLGVSFLCLQLEYERVQFELEQRQLELERAQVEDHFRNINDRQQVCRLFRLVSVCPSHFRL
jgi:hypothetical protein